MYHYPTLLYQTMKNANVERVSHDRIQQLQDQRFRRLLKYAWKKSQFYRNFYSAHGISEDDLDDVVSTDLPIVDKKTIQENFDEVVCDPKIKRNDIEAIYMDPTFIRKKYLSKYQIIISSGTSGSPSFYLYSIYDWARLNAIGQTHVSKSKFQLKRIKVVYLIQDYHPGTGISIAANTEKLLYNCQIISPSLAINEIVGRLNHFQPDYLSGYSSFLFHLAKNKTELKLSITPQKIFGSGDAMTPAMKSTITDAFGVVPYNVYCATESPAMGMSCIQTDVFYLFNDWNIFDLDPINLGRQERIETGTLILTNLYNYTQPIIRYCMGDMISIHKDKRQGDLPFMQVDTIGGRVIESLQFKNSLENVECILPHYYIENYYPIPGLRRLQFVQDTETHVNINIELFEDHTENTMKEIERQFVELLKMKSLEGQVQFTFHVMKEIPIDQQTGKFRPVIPLDLYKKTHINA